MIRCASLRTISKDNIKHIAFAFIFRGLGATALFVMNLVIARSLSIEESGSFFLVFSLLTVSAPICLLGTQTASVRFIGIYHSKGDFEVLSKLSAWGGGLGLTVSSFLAAVIWFNSDFIANVVFSDPSLAGVLRIGALGVVGSSIGFLVGHQLQAVKITYKAITVLSIGVPLLVSAFVTILNIYSAEKALVVLVLSYSVVCLWGCFFWRRFLGRSPCLDFSVSNIKGFLSSCPHLWVTAVMAAFTVWSSQLIAGALLSLEDVALLAVSQRTANLVSFILIAVNFVMAPQFAVLFERHDIIGLEQLAKFSVKLTLAVSLPVVFLIMLFPDYILAVFGPVYTGGALLLVVMAIGQFVNVATGSVGYLLTMTGHERDMRNVVIISGALSCLLPFALIPKFGVLGAAYATAIALSVQNLLAVYIVRKRLGFNPMLFWKQC